ncbi:unnamed protein product [Calypogeia fissa]
MNLHLLVPKERRGDDQTETIRRRRRGHELEGRGAGAGLFSKASAREAFPVMYVQRFGVCCSVRSAHCLASLVWLESPDFVLAVGIQPPEGYGVWFLRWKHDFNPSLLMGCAREEVVMWLKMQ